MINPHNLDVEISRRDTNSVKWLLLVDGDDPHQAVITDRFFGEQRTLPLWVADMDFRSPQPVIDALTARARHGIFGYTLPGDNYNRAVIDWVQSRHNWPIKSEWISPTPGVVPALNMLVRAFVQPGQKVIIQPPVYHPFYSVIKNNGVKIAKNQLLYENNRYKIDFRGLAEMAADPQVVMLILCSPHNPVGRVWTEEELTTLGNICLDNDVLVVSDEIHQDLTLFGQSFTPFARINERFAQNSVTCTAPSKTFNLAGLKTSNIIIPDPHKRENFQNELEKTGLFGLSPFGMEALIAAYNEGLPWLNQVLQYIEGNYLYLKEFLEEKIPEIKLIPLEGTYLAWLDCNGLGLRPKELRNLFLDKAQVCLNDGYVFGPEGNGFQRINIACPRSILEEALQRIERTIRA